MHHTLKKVANKRFADLVENIIKKQSEEDILRAVKGEMKNIKMKKFKNVDLIETINERVSEFDFMPTPAGEYAGEIMISVMKVQGKYKALKNFIETKLFKTKTKIDNKTMDAIFYLHTYRYALEAHNNKNVRKVLKIKKGFFS